MKPANRWILIAAAGVVLLLLPTLLRTLLPTLLRTLLGDLRAPSQALLPPASGPYQPPDVATPALALTPIPTPLPMRSALPAAVPEDPLRRGPVVVDLAHYSLIERARFQPLAAVLSGYGLDLRFWLPTVDTADITKITDFPDLSEELAKQLADASALVVISPFFLYTPAEIAVVERFLADGGRLLVISDPDVESDSASDTNQLAAAFNVIFNQDYLYDTVTNDENFTYFFQGEFFDEATDLAGSRIAFYGGRSIGGAVAPLVRSADTTLSSLRSGLTSFNTVVLGGIPANGSTGRVLAMSDFDVLTDPYVARHDNRRMLAYVGDFLAGAARNNHLVDFPSFLDKEVALAIDNTEPVGALSLAAAAALQRVLEASGRELRLGAADALTATAAGRGPDLIYMAGYRAADSQSDLLRELGITLVEEVITPTVGAPAAVPAVAPPITPQPEEEGEQPNPKETPAPPDLPPPEDPIVTPPAPPEVPPPLNTPDEPVAPAEPQTPRTTPATTATPAAVTPVVTSEADSTVTAPLTVTPTPDTVAQFRSQQEPITPTETPAPAAETTETAVATETLMAETPVAEPGAWEEAAPPEPQVRLLLDRGDGLRLLADETLLFIRRTHPAGTHTLAVLGNSEPAINAAMTRLLNRDFSGCFAQAELVICPYTPGTGATAGAADPAGAFTGGPAAEKAAGSAVPEAPDSPETPSDRGASVLVIDDDTKAEAGEPSEAAIYLVALTEAGYPVDNWVTSEQGMPVGEDLAPYRWVIWSDAGYAGSGIEGESLRAIGEYINGGGRLTISSRVPFFGVGAKSPSVIKDILVADEIPELTQGLPETPIVLNSASPVLTPLEENPDPSAGARTALARGPASADAGAPVLLVLSDAGFEEPKGALLMLFGLSMGWLPPDVSTQLIQNMAALMTAS